MLTKVRGRFTGVTGAIEVTEDPAQTTAEVAIDMASVDSGSQVRDDHLRSADFFDAAGHPTATFTGHVAHPWGGQRAVFTDTGTLNRRDWGLTWNLPLNGGGLLVSEEIRIEIELEAVLQS